MHPLVLLRYLRLPLHTAPLALIVIFGFMLTVAEHAGLFGIPVLAIITSWFLKYGFALLDDALNGRREPPVLSAEIANPVSQRPLGLFLLLLLFYSVTEALLPWVGNTVVWIVRALLLAIVPAMVASMTVTGRFVDAVNPMAVLGLIVRIPLAYATLLLVIGGLWFIAVGILQSAEHVLVGLWRVDSLLPWGLLSAIGMQGAVIGMVGLMVFMYLWLAMFACVGGTLYEHRKELEIDAAESPERSAARVSAEVERKRDKIMDQVFAQVRGGAFANAGDTVRKLIEQAPQPLDECRWVYARAAAADPRLADYLAQLTLPRLLDTRSTGEAWRMLRERLIVNPDFRPLTGGQLLQLAQLARDAGGHVIARQLLADFTRHYPNDRMEEMAAKLQAELAR